MALLEQLPYETILDIARMSKPKSLYILVELGVLDKEDAKEEYQVMCSKLLGRELEEVRGCNYKLLREFVKQSRKLEVTSVARASPGGVKLLCMIYQTSEKARAITFSEIRRIVAELVGEEKKSSCEWLCALVSQMRREKLPSSYDIAKKCKGLLDTNESTRCMLYDY